LLSFFLGLSVVLFQSTVIEIYIHLVIWAFGKTSFMTHRNIWKHKKDAYMHIPSRIGV
jgi:hypothetical protein